MPDVQLRGRVLAQDERGCLWQSLPPAADCLRCAEGRGCGAAYFSWLPQTVRSRHPALCALKPGTEFLARLPRRLLWPLLLLHYALPLLVFMGMLALLQNAPPWLQAGSAFLGLALAARLGAFWGRRRWEKELRLEAAAAVVCGGSPP